MAEINLLVTGFTPFPTAPVNPTEWLMGELERRGDGFEKTRLKTAVLPVAYGETIEALETVCADFAPDIAIHFGLAGEATCLRLERLARNAISAGKPDNQGVMPPFQKIAEQFDDVPSGLPLQMIHDHLQALGFDVEWSDDAGGYLCNYLFFHSASGLCKPLAGAKSGFIHVPLTVEAGGHAMTNAQLAQAAIEIIQKTLSSGT